MTFRVTIEQSFRDGAAKLPPDRRKAVNDTLVKFMQEPKLPSLRFRRLRGTPNYWLINSRHGDRVVLRKDEEDLFAAVDAGLHDDMLDKKR